MSRPESTIFFWEDRARRSYVYVRESSGHWRVEWGFYDPSSSEHVVQIGDHETSGVEEAVGIALNRIRALADEPDEVDRVAPRLRDAIRAQHHVPAG